MFASFQFNYYSGTIGKVTKTHPVSEEMIVDENGNQDKKSIQTLEINILNHDYKGQSMTLTNEFTYSQVNNHQYHPGDYLFIQVNPENNKLSGHIIELKRDTFLILLISMLVLLLIVVSGNFGLLTFLGFILNACLLGAILILYRHVNNQLLILLFIIAFPIMVALSLTLVNGWQLKTKITTVATILGTLITFLIGFIVISLFNHNGLHYEEMELVTRPPHVLFLSSLLIGSVGAVMDVSMTIVSSLTEIIHNKKTVSLDELNTAGKRIGEDIMGPMTNIMFFSYLSGAIPLVLIFLRNGMSFSYTFSIVLSLEIARALVGSIGIILAVPISIKVTQFFVRKEIVHER